MRVTVNWWNVVALVLIVGAVIYEATNYGMAGLVAVLGAAVLAYMGRN